MTDAERVLSVLIHDVRSPLAVALGYLRLVGEARLGDPQEREAALARTMDALGRIGRLCAQAETFLESGEATTGRPVVAKDLAERVALESRERGLVVEIRSIDAEVRLRAGASLDRLADAIAQVLGTVPDAADPHVVTICVDGEVPELQFLKARQDQLPAFMGTPPVRFDPWRNPGLAIPLACRAISAAGGRVWSSAETPHAIAIAFPLENSRS